MNMTDELKTGDTLNNELGLSDAEALRRLSAHGPNELQDKGSKSAWMILADQFSSAMVVILILAAALSAAMGDFKNAAAISAIVILNAVLGFFQEYKAEKAIAALKKMSVPQVRVRRSGEIKMISARDLVPGDRFLLEAGNFVPADGLVIESHNLRIQEAALTGESEPVEKHSYHPHSHTPEKRHLVYRGTLVAYGRAEVQVLETGMKTELGKIASLIGNSGQPLTPLQKRLDLLGKQLALFALMIVTLVFILGIFHGEDLKLMFMTAVSLAVAAIPEGLPAVVTIALALGAQRMLKRRALIRKLPAVETLGSVTVICSDKTGTLTENKMTVIALDGSGSRLDLTEHFKNNEPSLQPNGRKASPLLQKHSALNFLLTAGALCNDATLSDTAEISATGDPTETALVVAAARLGIRKTDAEKVFARKDEIPFDSHRKRMVTLHHILHAPFDFLKPFPGIVFVKGALEGVLHNCDEVWLQDSAGPLSEGQRLQIIAAHEELTKEGMRVLAVAMKPLHFSEQKENWEKDLIFMGLIGMIDPARSEISTAVETCKRAGIRPVMITGDHPHTARYVAKQAGIPDDAVLTGMDLDKMAAHDLERAVETVSVYARVTPEHKLKIVQALQRHGHVVAMTGDGVNDAPALKKADIGVAMGITGTDVSREAADMVLLDDNFSTIVAAVEEGRVIYDNIRKFIKYLVTTNSAEVYVMLLAPLFGMPLPLLPLQILWINLVTDGPVALALGVEPAEKNIMRRRPYPLGENIFSRGLARHIIWAGVFISILTFGAGYFSWRAGRESWQTMLFTVLALTQMGQALGIRLERESAFRSSPFSNKFLLSAVASTVLLQIAVVYMPFCQGIFKTVPLSWQELAICFGLSGLVFLAVELEKFLARSRFFNIKKINRMKKRVLSSLTALIFMAYPVSLGGLS